MAKYNSAETNSETRTVTTAPTADSQPTLPDPDAALRQARVRWIMLALIVLTLACYWQVGRADFINYDDAKYITDNPEVFDGLTWKSFLGSFTSTAGGYRHPLTWWSHLLDVTLFGYLPKTGSAGGHHLMNLLFHTADTVLLFWVLLRMTGATWPSAWVAAMFAVHPTHVESVAWVSERKDVLSTLFLLLTILAYQRYTERRTLARYGVVALAFVAALMSKPMMVTAPAILLLLDIWPLRRIKLGAGFWASLKQPIVEKLPLLALSLVSGAITIYDTASIKSFAGTDVYPIPLRLQTSIIGYARYLGKLFWPTKLAIFYPYPPNGWPTMAVVGATALFVVITSVVIWQMKRRAYLLVGWLWFVGTLLPVIGLLISGDASLADRYTYVPFIGLFIILAWLAREVGRKLNAGRVVAAAGAVAVLVCSAMTMAYVPKWRDSFAIMGHSKSVVKDNWTALMQYGVALTGERRNDEAAGYFREVLRIKPMLQVAHIRLGRYLLENDRLDEAKHHLRIAATGDPEHPGLLATLGQLHARLGNHQEALKYYDKALTKRAARAETLLLSAYSLLALGKVDDAASRLEEVLRINPNAAEAHHRLGLIASARRDLKSAEERFTTAAAAEPTWALPRLDYGMLLARLGRAPEAIEQLEQAITLAQPSEVILKARAEAAIARLLDLAGRKDEAAPRFARAVSYAREGVAQRPLDADAHYQLALQLKQTGQPDEAQEVARRGMELAIAAKNYMILSLLRGAFPEVTSTQPTTQATQPATTQNSEPRTQ